MRFGLVIIGVLSAVLAGGHVTARQRPEAEPTITPEDLQRLQTQIIGRLDGMRAATVAVRAGTERASGVVIAPHHVITAAHAVRRSGQRVAVVTIDGTTRDGTVVGIDRTNDIAVLQIDSVLRNSASFRTTSSVAEIGIAVGHPGGFETTRGPLVRIGRTQAGRIIRSGCRIAQGDSGGPLFDLSGQLIGIHREIEPSPTANLHTSVRTFHDRWKELTDGPKPVPDELTRKTAPLCVTAPYPAIAVHAGPEARRIAAATVVDHAAGLLLTKASALPARQVQLIAPTVQQNATVIAIDRGSDLALVKSKPLPERWKVNWDETAGLRTGLLTISPTAKRAARVGIAGCPPRGISRDPGTMGISVEQTGGQLTVREVRPNSAAQKARILVGDVLTEVSGETVSRGHQLAGRLRNYDAGDRLSVSLRRNGKPRSVELQLRHRPDRRFEDKAFQKGATGGLSRRRSGFSNVFQHDPDLHPQECGGPVFDVRNRLVGINIAVAGREAVYLLPTKDCAAVVEKMRRSATR